MLFDQSSGNYTKYKRLRSAHIEHGYGGIPAITCIMEWYKDEDGVVSFAPADNLIEPFTDDNATEEFNLYHPTTGALIGTSTYQNVFLHLFGLINHLNEKSKQSATPEP